MFCTRNHVISLCVLPLAPAVVLTISLHSAADEVDVYELQMEEILAVPTVDQRTLHLPETCGYFRGQQFLCQLERKSARTSQLGLPGSKAVGVAPYPAPRPFYDEHELYTIDTTQFAPRMDVGSPQYSLVPSKNVLFGEEVRSEWDRLISTGASIACLNDRQCSKLIKAKSNHNGKTVTGIAVCKVLKLARGFSPPLACKYIAIDIPNEKGFDTYIQAMTLYEDRVYGAFGRTDFWFVLADSKIAAVLDDVDSRLQQHPFFADITREGDQLIAVNNFGRFDPLGLFALYTVRISRGGIWTDRRPAVSVATSLFVSPRTSESSHEWHMASPQHNEIFVRSLRLLVLEAAGNKCPGTYSQTGSFYVFSC